MSVLEQGGNSMARQYTANTLLQTYKWAKAHPNGIIPIDRMERLTGEEWLRWFRKCLDRKVSHTMPGFEQGRKWENDWCGQAWRTAREVNTPRLIVRWIPLEFRERLAHCIWAGE